MHTSKLQQYTGKTMNWRKLLSFTILPFIFTCTSVLVAVNVSAKDTLVLCRVSENPKKHIEQLQPIVDYVANKLRHLGIKKGEVRFARNNREVINYFKQGKIDWVTETPFSAVSFERGAGAEPILLRWKKGVRQYHSIIITKQSRDIKSIDDLVGNMISFEDRGSTSGFMLPLASLLQQGVELVELSGPRDTVPEGKVGYVFAKQEMNISNLVYRDITQAGAMSNLDWEEEDRVNKTMKSGLKILHRTQDVPRSLELVRGDLDSEIKQAIRDILSQAHEDPEAAAALKAYKKTKKFEKLDESTLRELESIRVLVDLLNTHTMM